MYDYTLHLGKKVFLLLLFARFWHKNIKKISQKLILKSHINKSFKFNGKQVIQMLKEGEYLN